MEIYLPIAEISVNIFVILGLGAMVGILSGLLGVGGGVAMTPILIFMGIPPAIAVSSQANHLIAASASGTMAHLFKKNIDFKMGAIMLIGGGMGSIFGVYLFHILQYWGQIDFAISILYVVFLGSVGSMMLWESMTTSLTKQKNAKLLRGFKKRTWLHRLPFKMKFPRSKLYISAILPIFVGFVGGVLVAIMGIGGGFILVPAMIYLVGVPFALVAGTSLFQIIFSTMIVTFLQGATNYTVDIILAFLLLIGGVVGAQIGSKLSGYLRSEHSRGLLALILLIIAFTLGKDLTVEPDNLYSITMSVY